MQSGLCSLGYSIWAWGRNEFGELGQNQGSNAYRSSPVQIPGTTWAGMGQGRESNYAVKTDGTLWVWGPNHDGQLGLNDEGDPPGAPTGRSSPVQLGSETTWSSDHRKWGSNTYNILTVKTDGTLWGWGRNNSGDLGLNQASAKYSSPVQIPGTTWDKISGGASAFVATKTDGTLWSWGTGTQGNLGQNQGPSGSRSSPTQIPGTWAYPLAARYSYFAGGLKES